jgi:transposase
VIDICEIFAHWHAGRSKDEIAVSLGLSRNTVRKYVSAAEAAGMVPGGPAVSQERWGELAREWFPELADTRLRQVTWPAIGAHRDYIAEQLKAGVTVATIHQRLRDEWGLAALVASVRPVCGGEPAGGGAEGSGAGAAAGAGRAGPGSAGRLRAAGPVDRPGDRAAACGERVRDGAVLLADAVRAGGAGDGPAGVDRVPCRGVRVLRRGAGPTGARQPEDRGRPAGLV